MSDITFLEISELNDMRTKKQQAHTINMSYYEGTRKPYYLSPRLREFFESNTHYKQNWMSVVVDAVRNKMTVEGFNVGEPKEGPDGEEIDDPRQQRLNEIWDNALMPIEADYIHEMCHATGEAFLVIGTDDETGDPVAYGVDPRAVVVYYGSANPRQITQAVYYWMDGEINMATAWQLQGDTVYEETLKGEKRTGKDVTPATQTQLNYASQGKPVKTTYPRIPVFHFRRTLRDISPEFARVKDIQDTINKTFAMQGFGVENTADKVRWAITNSDMSELSNAKSGDVVTMPPAPHNMQPSEVGEFGAGDFSSLTGIIDDGVMAIASITATPRHLFKGEGLGAGMSGEALQAMEAPLNAKTYRYIRLHSPQWESAAAMMLTMDGTPTDTSDITCNYSDPRTVLAISQATAREANVRAGIPITTQLRNEGWRQSELDQMLADRESERPVEVDEEARQALYDTLSEKAARDIEPMLAIALQAIADAALDEITGGDRMERLAAAVQPETTGS